MFRVAPTDDQISDGANESSRPHADSSDFVAIDVIVVLPGPLKQKEQRIHKQAIRQGFSPELPYLIRGNLTAKPGMAVEIEMEF